MAGSLIVDTGRKDSSWVSYIKSRIKKKKNFLGVITGPTGSGKSWTGLSMCLEIDPTFTQDRIVTRAIDLMKLVNSGKLETGNAILWDEGGVDNAARSWQSKVNKVINQLLQTFRHKRLVLIMTVPAMDFIDASTRKLLHAIFTIKGIDEKKKTTKVKPLLMQFNERTGKIYYKRLWVVKNGGPGPLNFWNIKAPPVWLAEAYEEIKNQFTSTLNIALEQELEEEYEKKLRGKKRRELTEKQELVLSTMADLKDASKVAEKLNINERTVFFHIAQAKKKGYTLEEFSQKGELQKNVRKDEN